MGVPYTKYRTDTGEIVSTGDCSNEEQCFIQMNDPENEHVLIGVKADDATQYVNEEGEVADRPQLNVADEIVIQADGVEKAEVSLPEGSSVITYSGQLFPVGDGFSFDTTLPGSYRFEIVPPFPFVSKVLTIIAN